MAQPGTSRSNRKRKREVSSRDPNYEETLEQWLHEKMGDFSDVDEEQVDPDFCIISDHDTESEQSEDKQLNEGTFS